MQSYIRNLEENKAIRERTTAPKQPAEFTLNGTTYIHIPATETFHIKGTPEEEAITMLQIMKKEYPETRGKYQRIEPPSPFFLVGNSARYKMLRLVQYHDDPPPITPSSDALLPMFQYLSSGLEDHWTVQSQFSSAKFATHDDAAAAAMLLHYGWATDYKIQIPGSCIYRIMHDEDGIILDIEYVHTFNERLQAACLEIQSMYSYLNENNYPVPFEDLCSYGYRTFFSYKKRFVSMTAAYRQAVLNKIQAFTRNVINVLKDTAPPLPTIEEPEDLLEDQPLIRMKWSDFKFVGASDSQQSHIDDIGRRKNLVTMQRLNVLPPDKLYRRCEIIEHIAPRALQTALKHGFITKASDKPPLYKLTYERSDE